MSPIPSREDLEVMKRIDIQKLCKDYGVKANLKTEALIELLIDASKPRPQRPTVSQQPQATSRRVSSRAGQRSRGMSGSSMIIHDTDEEDEEEIQEPLPEQTHQLPRTRKAKETQTRLGVGRPIIAGGSGARAVTKSLSVPRNKRGKGSMSIKPTEDTIPEEEAEAFMESGFSALVEPMTSILSKPNTEHAAAATETYPKSSYDNSLASLEEVDKHVAEALRPLHEQMHSLKAELERLKVQVTDIDRLKQDVQALTTEVEGLRNNSTRSVELEQELNQLKTITMTGASEPGFRPLTAPNNIEPPGPLLRTSAFNFGTTFPANANATSSSSLPEMQSLASHASTIQNDHPDNDVARTTLGKRHRDSTESNVTGVFEEGLADELSKSELERGVARPDKKRPKMTVDVITGDGSPPGTSSKTQSLKEDQDPAPPRGFTVFSGPSPETPSSYIDPPLPSTHLLDFFAPPSPSSQSHSNPNGPTTSTANASENQHPFSFAFLPVAATPSHPIYPTTMASFPYPEPPQSPSPAGPSHHTSLRLPPRRPRSGNFASRVASASSDANEDSAPSLGPGAFISSVAPTQPVHEPPEREVTSNDVAAGLGLTSVKTAEPIHENLSTGPAKKTMYGTELDRDTRFGDFGVEGVATGFWAGGRY